MLENGIHVFSPAAQLALLPLVWGGVPLLYMAMTRSDLCAPAKGWWALSIIVYSAWLVVNNPIAADVVRSFA